VWWSERIKAQVPIEIFSKMKPPTKSKKEREDESTLSYIALVNNYP
jgi:hypothetical protein